MGINRAWYTQHDSGLANAPKNYGPIVMGGPAKIVRITARGGISYAPQTQTTANNLITPLQHGFQQVPSGNAPANMEGGTFNPPQWVLCEGITPSPTSLFWAPSTDTAAWEDRYEVDLEWVGQFRYLANIDIYYSIGRFVTPSVGFGFWGAVEVLFDA